MEQGVKPTTFLHQHDRKIAAAHAAGRARSHGTRFAPRDGERRDPSGRGCGARRQLGRFPMRLNETTRAYFRAAGGFSAPELAARYRDILNPARAAEADRISGRTTRGHYSDFAYFRGADDHQHRFPLERNSVRGEAMLDVRALPDEDMPKFVAALRGVINDPAIDLIPPKTNARRAARPFLHGSIRSYLRSLGGGAANVHVPTLPSMMTGATDNAQLRAKGAYGTGPVVTPGRRRAGRRSYGRREYSRARVSGDDGVYVELGDWRSGSEVRNVRGVGDARRKPPNPPDGRKDKLAFERCSIDHEAVFNAYLSRRE